MARVLVVFARLEATVLKGPSRRFLAFQERIARLRRVRAPLVLKDTTVQSSQQQQKFVHKVVTV